jgi:hypothetical protein
LITIGLPILHIGFAHSGTTSLQENIFSRRSDLFYAGIPYGELGGIFSWVKYREPEHYDRAATAALCQDLIFSKMQPGQRPVITDETLVEQPAIYYTPAMMPVGMIAERLRDLFGPAIVLFTLRNQYRYVLSLYSVLKRNYAALANREIEPFASWFAGNQTQVRNLFLRNLDPSHAVRVYERVFGPEAVHVLPLELLTRDGTGAYLDRLGAISDLAFTDIETAAYPARNPSPAHDIVLSDEQRALIRQRAGSGNTYVAERFRLPLADLGYPLP